MSKQLFFQLGLLALIAFTGLASVFFNQYALIVFIVLVAANFIAFTKLGEGDKKMAGFLFIASSVIALALSQTSFLVEKNLLFMLPLLPAAFLIFWKLLLPKKIEVKVIGCVKGFAVVEVTQSFSHDVKPGFYAVEARKKIEGKANVVVERSLFNAPELKELK